MSYDIDPIKNAGEKHIFNNLCGKWSVQKMTWYIQQGNDLMRARPIEFDFFRQFHENPSHEDLQTEEILLECGSIEPPRHPRDGILKEWTYRWFLRSFL
jgi:hypothetical protein